MKQKKEYNDVKYLRCRILDPYIECHINYTYPTLEGNKWNHEQRNIFEIKIMDDISDGVFVTHKNWTHPSDHWIDIKFKNDTKCFIEDEVTLICEKE